MSANESSPNFNFYKIFSLNKCFLVVFYLCTTCYVLMSFFFYLILFTICICYLLSSYLIIANRIAESTQI